MIIYYDKTTGDIVGTQGGRTHTQAELNMWVGDKEKTDRLVIPWVKADSGYEPKHSQKDLFLLFDSKKEKIRNYRINLLDKTLTKI